MKENCSAWKKINEELLPYQARLIAVSKTKTEGAILSLYEKGQRDFGENRVPELAEKAQILPQDIRWHMIGHLQRNKVKNMISFVHLIHSVDSSRLLEQINKEAQKANRVIDCLLQFKIAEEETKYGFDENSAKAMLDSREFASFQNVRITGVMGMATFTDNRQQVREEFRRLKQIFDQLKAAYFPDAEFFREISMGMSDDYDIALEEGSTMVRIGTLLFGAR